MGRWLQLARNKKNAETLLSEANKTNTTSAEGVSLVLLAPQKRECEKFYSPPDSGEGGCVGFVGSVSEENQNFFSEPTPLEWSEDDWRYAFEERAAIYEFDGGYDRAEAERLARIEITAMKRRTIH
jgi:hypothetical protein